jgi:putative hydrolase of the HAD superfamily
MMIKNIIFDIGNVLIGFDWRDYMKGFGFSKEKENAIAKAMFGSPAWNEVDRGVLSIDEIEQLFIANAPQYADDIPRVFRGAPACLTRRDYAIPWIQELKSQGFSVYYLSNFSRFVLEPTRDTVLDFLPYMDGGVFSYELQLIKPDPAIFRALTERYPNIRPEESVFFDDTPANIEAAADLGFQAIHFRTKEQAETALGHLLEVMNR